MCLDGLRPVVVSLANATVIEATPSEVTVQLRVSQLFEEPGDSGVVVVYAHSEASDGGVLSTDVTHLVRFLAASVPEAPRQNKCMVLAHEATFSPSDVHTPVHGF